MGDAGDAEDARKRTKMRLLAHNMLACNAKVRAREETRGRRARERDAAGREGRRANGLCVMTRCARADEGSR